MVGKLGYEPLTALLRNMIAAAWVFKIFLAAVIWVGTSLKGF